KARPRKTAPTKSLVFVFRAAVVGNSRSSTPGTGATSPTQLAAVVQLLLSGLPPSQTRVAGASRSSSASTQGRAEGRRMGLAWGRAAAAFRFRLKNENTMARNLLWECSLRYNGSAIAPGAQTERRGGAWPVRDLLGGKVLTDRLVCPRQSPGTALMTLFLRLQSFTGAGHFPPVRTPGRRTRWTGPRCARLSPIGCCRLSASPSRGASSGE